MTRKNIKVLTLKLESANKERERLYAGLEILKTSSRLINNSDIELTSNLENILTGLDKEIDETETSILSIERLLEKLNSKIKEFQLEKGLV